MRTIAPITPAADTGPVHLTYTEPHADHGTWTSPPRCLPDRATADVIAAGRLSGPDARARRTWAVSPCDCPSAR